MRLAGIVGEWLQRDRSTGAPPVDYRTALWLFRAWLGVALR